MFARLVLLDYLLEAEAFRRRFVISSGKMPADELTAHSCQKVDAPPGLRFLTRTQPRKAGRVTPRRMAMRTSRARRQYLATLLRPLFAPNE